MQQRIVALDGLRAVAVLIVFVGHLAPTYLPGGGLGVDIFFALSGFLITSILLDEYRARGEISFKHFYLRRAARLMPALVFLLLAASLVILISPRRFYGWEEVVYAGLYIMNWVRALGWGDSAFLAHTWSLAVEEQFYLLWPPILLLVMRYRAKAAPFVAVALTLISIACSIALYFAGATPERIYNGFDTRAAGILAGCVAAFLPLEGRIADAMARLWLIPAAVLVGDIFLLDGHILYVGGYGLRGVVAAWLIIALRKGCLLAMALENPLMVYIGQISYGLYLWHYFFISVFGVHGLQSWSRNLPAVAATFLVASVSYHFVEQPILRVTKNSFVGRPKAPKGTGPHGSGRQSRS